MLISVVTKIHMIFSNDSIAKLLKEIKIVMNEDMFFYKYGTKIKHLLSNIPTVRM